jgi:hypothetical protein
VNIKFELNVLSIERNSTESKTMFDEVIRVAVETVEVVVCNYLLYEENLSFFKSVVEFASSIKDIFKF